MNKGNIIEQTKQFIQAKLSSDYTGHDWWHINRVWKTAKLIAQKEDANMLLVELAALLHDIADWKLHGGDEQAGPNVAHQWLSSFNLDNTIIDTVCDIILNMSFKGANVVSKLKTMEGCIVQDADRLDAMGAIGIARTFAFGGAFAQPIYDPEIAITYHNTIESYKHKKTTSINHFYEKLLLLKDRMNTATGKQLAENRHQFMVLFLQQFHQDWESSFLSENAVLIA